MEWDMHSPNAWIERIELLVAIVLQLAITVVVAGAIVDRVLSPQQLCRKNAKPLVCRQPASNMPGHQYVTGSATSL